MSTAGSGTFARSVLLAASVVGYLFSVVERRGSHFVRRPPLSTGDAVRVLTCWSSRVVCKQPSGVSSKCG
ncbi:unnamed protein product [Amoebophrya sp. A120]|nr:unnamed protein product [Amoebophrya sp. A120]|eukprot:GSA120T00012109001.1